MSDIKLFRIGPQGVAELKGQSLALERSLQALMERNLDTLLGVRFLASEHSTGAKHKGRIDTLGLDENGCPVIIEYKRATNENVINQGLFYLDWLMDHQAEFKLLVLEKLGKAAADAIEWGGPRLLCIVGDFTRYDEHAVRQMNRNIELIRYRYGHDAGTAGAAVRDHPRSQRPPRNPVHRGGQAFLPANQGAGLFQRAGCPDRPGQPAGQVLVVHQEAHHRPDAGAHGRERQDRHPLHGRSRLSGGAIPDSGAGDLRCGQV